MIAVVWNATPCTVVAFLELDAGDAQLEFSGRTKLGILSLKKK
jgi:hypothetical protein